MTPLEILMLTKTPHLFDDATKVTAGDSRWQGHTSDDYWAFVGPFGGCTAATILRALIEHPQAAGDPVAMTVNYCAPVAKAPFDLDVRLVKANRSSQHWCVEMSQDGGEVSTLATAVFAERRPSWSHPQAKFPGAKPSRRRYPTRMSPRPGSSNMTSASSRASRSAALGGRGQVFQAVDRRSRAAQGRHAVADGDVGRFFARIFHAKRELVPFGTVSLTTYFHVDAADLAAEDTTHVLGVADAKIFHKSYGDKNGELWSPGGRLLATTTQIAYFKA